MCRSVDERPVVLVVSPLESDHRELRDILHPEGWIVRSSRSCAETLALLEPEAIRVVIAERDLPDGNWETVLGQIERMVVAPKLIVTSRLADHYLWAEVLNRGGFDVLAQPFDRREVLRSVLLACRSADPECPEANSCASHACTTA